MLRPYQQKTIDDLYSWYNSNSGNPVIVLPTGSGKSHVIAEICRTALSSFPETRILMLTTQKELIEQNCEKLLLHWENAPVGIYSAGMNSKDLSKQITFASIQSIRNQELQSINLVIIDEAHQINHKDEGIYRKFLTRINPDSIIGLTASPFRMGHGLITDDPAIFDALIEPVSIIDLQKLGFLANLVSKVTREKLDVTGVHKRGGDYIESELQKAVDITETNLAVVEEVLRRAETRKSWLFFCTGVKHAEHIRNILEEKGITAECVTGKTPKKTREKILADFKSGKIQALTNANVLTTGFDAPNIDLIAMVRPTESAGLYIQMAGRGLRLKDNTDHCLVLDFAGVIERHGAITDVQTPNKKSEEAGIPPSKICPECDSIVPAQCRICPDCGNAFDIKKQLREWKLRHDDIMGLTPKEFKVKSWRWSKYISRKSGKEMLRISYYGEALSDPPMSEYLAILHQGYAGKKAMLRLKAITDKIGVNVMEFKSLSALINGINKKKAPEFLTYRKDGKYNKILEIMWSEK